MTPEMGRAEDVAKKIRIELERRGLLKEPLGVDIDRAARPVRAAEAKASTIVDGQQLMSEARVIKTQDEIALLNHVGDDGRCRLRRALPAMKPGHARKRSGRRSSPRCSTTSAPSTSRPSTRFRANAATRTRTSSPTASLRPGDPVYYDILHSYMGYRTCYYRCFAIGYGLARHGRCLQALPRLSRRRHRAHSAGSHDRRDRVRVAARRRSSASRTRRPPSRSSTGHGIGLAIWEKPVISRLVSLEHPHEIKPGMVFALETFWPSTDGWSAARIEEEIVVTATGHEVITRFPAEELLVAGAPFVTVGGTLPDVRETETPPNPQVMEMIAAAARAEAAHERSALEADGHQRGDACARDGAGNRQARLVAEEGRGRSSPRATCSSKSRPTRLLLKSRLRATAFSPASPHTRRRHPCRPHDCVARSARRIAARLQSCACRQWTTNRCLTCRGGNCRNERAFHDGCGARISPKARRLANEHGVDLSQVRGSGPGGEILADDILAAAEQVRSKPDATAPARLKPDTTYESEQARLKPDTTDESATETVTTIGRLMAERTTQSWTTVPHFFVTRQVDAGALKAARDAMQPAIEKSHGVKVTYTDLIVRAAARTLKRHPRLNASWTDNNIVVHADINVALAMAVENAVVTASLRRPTRQRLPTSQFGGETSRSVRRPGA